MTFRAALAVLGGALLGLLPAQGAHPDRLLHHDRTVLRGEGRSMLPTLPEACRLVLVRIPFAEVRVGRLDGDLVSTRLNGKNITHRAVARLPDGRLVTWGDNNSKPDPLPTGESNYVGIVAGFEPVNRPGELVRPAALILASAQETTRPL